MEACFPLVYGGRRFVYRRLSHLSDRQ